MKLIIGNKNYSSWSLRGWLAVRQSGLHFEEITIPLYGEGWDQQKRERGEIAPSQGKVPVLWDGEAVVWDSLAIIDYLADKVGRDRFWPKPDDARAMARLRACLWSTRIASMWPASAAPTATCASKRILPKRMPTSCGG